VGRFDCAGRRGRRQDKHRLGGKEYFLAVISDYAQGHVMEALLQQRSLQEHGQGVKTELTHRKKAFAHPGCSPGVISESAQPKGTEPQAGSALARATAVGGGDDAGRRLPRVVVQQDKPAVVRAGRRRDG
jgi:hypothetical protein